MRKLHKNVYCHTTRDGMNIGCVVGDDGPLSIDLPATPEEAVAWRAQLAEVSDRPLRAVIFTATDRVSSAALAAISPIPGALSVPAVIQENGFLQLFAALEASQPRAIEPLSPAQLRERTVLPDVTFSESMTLIAAGTPPTFVDIRRAAGYSPGSAIVTVRDTGVVFAGDHVTSREPPPFTAADLDAWQAVLAELRRNRRISTLVPGRGPLGDAGMITETLAYLKAARAAAQKLIKAHRPRSDAGAVLPNLVEFYVPAPGKAPRRAAPCPALGAAPEAGAAPEPIQPLPPEAVAAITRRIQASLESLYDTLNQAGPNPADPGETE